MLLLQRSPFYGTLLMNTPIIEDRGIETACTDGRRIYYNPAFMSQMKESQRRYVLMHELFHILLMHPSRMRDRYPDLYNVAADMLVNSHCDQLTTRFGMTRPEVGVFAHVRSDQSAEELYNMLLKDNPDWGKRKHWLVKLRKHYAHGDMPADIEANVPKSDLLPGRLSDMEAAALSREIQRLVREAVRNDPGMGPSVYIPREIIALGAGRKLPWKQLFKAFMTEMEDDDASYATPERKYLHMDLILPGHCETEGRLSEVWAFVDSSGSITKDQMGQFLTQLYRISKEFKCTMHIAYWDTAVTDVYKNVVGEKKILECLPKHSGGTDINCVYKWIREQHLKPDVMLILTDGAFGTLREEFKSKRLRERTILVLSNDRFNTKTMTQIGKVAILEGA